MDTRPPLDAVLGRHPSTGQPIRPLWTRPDGRPCWPILGAAPDDPADDATGGPGGEGDLPAAGNNAVDAQGNDLGFPKGTPVAEMSDKEQAAYWKHNSRRHESRFKDLVGGRRAEDIKKDLAELDEVRNQSMTDAERVLNERYEAGKAEGAAAERRQAATAIFRGALEANGVTGDDLAELVENFNVAGYVGDSVDTTKITNFAKRFRPAGTAGHPQRRDFGAGPRGQAQPGRGAAGKAEAERRFGKRTTTTDA